MDKVWLIIITLCLPFCFWLFSHIIPRIKRAKITKYVHVYLIIIGRVLSEEKERYKEALCFYNCWWSWIYSSACNEIGCVMEHPARTNTPQMNAWKCLDHVVEHLGKTIYDYSLDHHIPEDLRFPNQINVIKEIIQELWKQTYMGDAELNSIPAAMKKYSIPYWEVR